MYIAIEGIKGGGKSTIAKQVIKRFEAGKNTLEIFPITRELPAWHPYERLHRCNPILKMHDQYIEKLFVERANWNLNQIKSSNMVLGDRSLITSYVTRWNKWNDPYYTVRRVSKMQPRIEHPQVIIWLKCSVEKAVRQINNRRCKGIGSRDEEIRKIQLDKEVYEELFQDKLYTKKIYQSQIVEVNLAESMEESIKEIFSVLKFYYK